MESRKIALTTLALGLILGLSACGSGGSSTLPYWQTVYGPSSGFRVINADPYPNTESVPVASSINILFSDSVDLSTVDASIKIYETANGATVDWTTNCSVSYGSTNTVNDMYVCTHVAKNLNPNAKYQVSISTTLKSGAGAALIQPTSYVFATGSLTGYGGIVSVDGPPQVTHWTIFVNPNSQCLDYVQVDFNEDLQAITSATYKLTAYSLLTFRWVTVETGPMGPEVNPYTTTMRSWYLLFPDYACSADYFGWFPGAGNKLEVTINEAIDTTNTIGTASHTFKSNGLTIQ
ncbi:MAG: Ig-like domain-containing protein [Pseudomonadota bacterium]